MISDESDLEDDEMSSQGMPEGGDDEVEQLDPVVDMGDGSAVDWLKSPGLAGSAMIIQKQGAQELQDEAKQLYDVICKVVRDEERDTKCSYEVQTFGSLSYGGGTKVSDLDVIIFVEGDDQTLGHDLLNAMAVRLEHEDDISGLGGWRKILTGVDDKSTLEFKFRNLECDLTFGMTGNAKCRVP